MDPNADATRAARVAHMRTLLDRQRQMHHQKEQVRLGGVYSNERAQHLVFGHDYIQGSMNQGSMLIGSQFTMDSAYEGRQTH